MAEKRSRIPVKVFMNSFVRGSFIYLLIIKKKKKKPSLCFSTMPNQSNIIDTVIPSRHFLIDFFIHSILNRTPLRFGHDENYSLLIQARRKICVSVSYRHDLV